MKEVNKGIIARKVGMTQVFDDVGNAVPATVLEILKQVVVQKKTIEKDGYCSVKVGYKETDESKLNKAEIGQQKGTEIKFKKFKEIRLKNSDKIEIGDEISLSQFDVGEKINVSGTTKGRGFSGTVKRYNFHIGPMAHGSKNHRRQGTIGGGTGQGKVWKGQKMPGHYGNDQRTVKNIKIIKVIAEKNLMIIKGAVPGHNNSMLEVYN
jgi:large subunit ribosomal protein L3